MGNPLISFDITKSLQELDGDDWGEPTYNTNLVKNVHRLRTVPLIDFTNEDLRLMIGQKFCLAYLVPIAIERLAENEFVSGERYTGDLLCAMLDIGYEFWKENIDLHWEFNSIVIGVNHCLEVLKPLLGQYIPPKSE
ncbi:contact-dependent growth inhibition system immunity protein [Paenibacillus terrigena]|uniref:contact-dependent growth inhibition system immunity protein n=1 Tax=Paenibacillus terrigena TaxID=369333 RepID=UPI000373015D|nr:contact-dependent growth inhibition system immunity protein [Paenibacillus terrigena]